MERYSYSIIIANLLQECREKENPPTSRLQNWKLVEGWDYIGKFI